MIVEFVGSTGAGKTTLISEVQPRLAGVQHAASSLSLAGIPLGVRAVRHPTAQNLLQELVGFPFFLSALHRHGTFISFFCRMLARHGKFTFYSLNYLRSLERTLGVNELIRWYGRGRIVLVDEGTLILAHNLFVYTNAVYTAEEIAKFAALVPLPDLIIYVRVPVDVLVERSLRRCHPPREMSSRDRSVVARYVQRAVAVYEQLVEAQNIRGRVLIVENRQGADGWRAAAADAVAEFIWEHAQTDREVRRLTPQWLHQDRVRNA